MGTTYGIVVFVVLALFTAFELYVGLGIGYDKKVVSSSRGFFIGGGTGFFILFFTTAATWFSTWLYMGAPGSFYKNGIGWIAGAAWQLLIVFLMGNWGPKVWRLGRDHQLITPSDMLEGYYGGKAIRPVHATGELIFCFPTLMAQIAGCGVALDALTRGVIPMWAGCIYAAAVVGIYVYFGGFRSQAWVDTMQGILFSLIMWVTVIIMVKNSGQGGLTGFFAELERTGSDLLRYVTKPDGLNNGYWTWKMYLSFWIIQALGGFCAPYVFQRSYAAKDGKTVRRIAGLLGAYYVFILMAAVMLIGFGGHVLGIETANADNIMVVAMNKYAPYWAIFVVIGILCAGMSTVSSILVSATSIVSVDYGRSIKKDISDESIRKISKIAILGMLVLAVILSIVGYSSIAILINTALAGFAQSFWAIFGMFVWRKHATKEGAVSGLVVGLVITLVLTAMSKNLLGFAPGFWGVVCNGIVFFVVSLLTKPVDPAHAEEFLSPLVKHSVRNRT